MVKLFFTSTLSKVNEDLKVVVLIACEADLYTYVVGIQRSILLLYLCNFRVLFHMKVILNSNPI